MSETLQSSGVILNEKKFWSNNTETVKNLKEFLTEKVTEETSKEIRDVIDAIGADEKAFDEKLENTMTVEHVTNFLTKINEDLTKTSYQEVYGKFRKAATMSVQMGLKIMGYDIGAAEVDGQRWMTTRKAIQQFQALNGLTPDGYAGKDTVGKMLEVGIKKPTVTLDFTTADTKIAEYEKTKGETKDITPEKKVDAAAVVPWATNVVPVAPVVDKVTAKDIVSPPWLSPLMPTWNNGIPVFGWNKVAPIAAPKEKVDTRKYKSIAREQLKTLVGQTNMQAKQQNLSVVNTGPQFTFTDKENSHNTITLDLTYYWNGTDFDTTAMVLEARKTMNTTAEQQKKLATYHKTLEQEAHHGIGNTKYKLTDMFTPDEIKAMDPQVFKWYTEFFGKFPSGKLECTGAWWDFSDLKFTDNYEKINWQIDLASLGNAANYLTKTNQIFNADGKFLEPKFKETLKGVVKKIVTNPVNGYVV